MFTFVSGADRSKACEHVASSTAQASPLSGKMRHQ
jgi:hypothetical protein